MLGEHDAAIAGARKLNPDSLAGADNFLLADLLDAADRDDGGTEELESLAADPTRTWVPSSV